MEDEDLKALWRSDSSTKDTNKPDLDLVFKSKSKGILEKLQKTAKTEHYVNIVVSVLLVGYLFIAQMWYYALGLSVLMTAIVIYYKRLYDKVLNISYTENVLEYLVDIYNTMKDFKKRYFIGLLIIFPIAYILGFELGYDLGNSVESGKEIPEDIDKPDSIYKTLAFIGINAATLLISAVFINYLFYFLYGRRIKQVKAMINNLKNDE